MRLRPVLALAIYALVAAAGVGPGGIPARAAATVFVCTDGSNAVCNGTANVALIAAPDCAFARIAHAITQVDAGGEVQVGPGDYTTAAIVITKEVTVRGMPGNAKPNIIAASGPLFTCDPGFRCRFADLQIDGNGINNEIGIYYKNSPASTGSVRGVDFVDFNVGQGTGVSIQGRVTVADSTFSISGATRGIHVDQSAATILQNTLTGNTTGRGVQV